MIMVDGTAKMIAAGFLALIVFGLAWQPASASQLKVDMPYVEAREVLAASGWAPTNFAPADALDRELDDYLRADFLKRGMPEVGSCFGTGAGQCFAIWQRRNRLMVVESRLEGFDPTTGPTVYFFYEVRLHHSVSKNSPPPRDDWDPRSADVVPGSSPAGHPW
jgi:hypothetical protein